MISAELPGDSETKWSERELTSRLRDYEKELRAAGLSDNTVTTYVGRAETFVRWLTGRYSPVGPNAGSAALGAPKHVSVGQGLLDELAHTLDVDEISRYLAGYAAVTGYDSSLNRLHGAISGEVPDLDVTADRVAVIEWLRGWGCRHLRKTDTTRTSDVLGCWWQKWNTALPAPSVLITDLSETDLTTSARAYESLRSAPAAGRSLGSGEVDVLFGDTAAAKTMFVVKPQAFLPWDEPIRVAFGWTGGGAAYADYLRRSSHTLVSLGSRLNVPVAQLPTLFSRPASTPAKIIDEYLWVKATRGL